MEWTEKDVVELLVRRYAERLNARSLSTKQVAVALNVSVASVKRFCNAGKLKLHRTPGRHRLIDAASVAAYMTEHGRADPDDQAIPYVLTESGKAALAEQC